MTLYKVKRPHTSGGILYFVFLTLIALIHGFTVRGLRVESKALGDGPHGPFYWAYVIALGVAFLVGVCGATRLAARAYPKIEGVVAVLLMAPLLAISVMFGLKNGDTEFGSHLRYIALWFYAAGGATLGAVAFVVQCLRAVIQKKGKSVGAIPSVAALALFSHWFFLFLYVPAALCEKRSGVYCSWQAAGDIGTYMFPFRHVATFSLPSLLLIFVTMLALVSIGFLSSRRGRVVCLIALSCGYGLLMLPVVQDSVLRVYVPAGVVQIVLLHLLAVIMATLAGESVLSRCAAGWRSRGAKVAKLLPTALHSSVGAVCLAGAMFFIFIALLPDPLRRNYGDYTAAAIVQSSDFIGPIEHGWEGMDFIGFSLSLLIIGASACILTPYLMRKSPHVRWATAGMLLSLVVGFAPVLPGLTGGIGLLGQGVSTLSLGGVLSVCEAALWSNEKFVRIFGSGFSFAFIVATTSVVMVFTQGRFLRALFGMSYPDERSFILPFDHWQVGAFDPVDATGHSGMFAVPYLFWAIYPLCLIIPLLAAKLSAICPEVIPALVVVSFCWAFALGWASVFPPDAAELGGFWIWRSMRQPPLLILITLIPMLWDRTVTGQGTRPALKPVHRRTYAYRRPARAVAH